MRKIPATMATQHPDNAMAPYWDIRFNPFISAYQEIEEAYRCFSELGTSEYMWDWEGKHADAAVIDRMFSDYYDYFSKNQLGSDKFLTFRIPNIWEEKGYNLLLAMAAILSAEDFSIDLNYRSRPLFEVILPMTTRPEQLMRIHTLFEKLAKFKNSDFTKKEPNDTEYLELIPLFESVESQIGSKELLTKYLSLHKEHYGRTPPYLRPFLACSDSSLSSGYLAGLLGNKVALARLYEFSSENNIDIYPIAGPGGLNFRGGLTPFTIDRFIKELPGVKTVTVQSSFRYDYPIEEVKAAIAQLETKLPKSKNNPISGGEQAELINIAKKSEELYRVSLRGVAEFMRPLFRSVPKRRDRRQHVGLLSYARNVSGGQMPRAITFTGAFYSLGIPPEFIGLGQTLEALSDQQMSVLNKNYSSLKNDISRAGKFLNKENLEILSKKNKSWQKIAKDTALCEKILGLNFGPDTIDEKKHCDTTGSVLKRVNDAAALTSLIEECAQLRKSIG